MAAGARQSRRTRCRRIGSEQRKAGGSGTGHARGDGARQQADPLHHHVAADDAAADHGQQSAREAFAALDLTAATALAESALEADLSIVKDDHEVNTVPRYPAVYTITGALSGVVLTGMIQFVLILIGSLILIGMAVDMSSFTVS